MTVSHKGYHLVAAAWIAGAIGLGLATVAPAAADGHVTYSGDVFAVIEVRCLKCHKPGETGFEASGLDLRTYEGLMKGTKHGPIVIPGDAFTSNLNVLVEGRAAKAIQMPHGEKKLTKCERDILRRWVNSGAKND